MVHLIGSLMSTTNTCAKCNLGPEDWTSEKLKLCSKCRTVYYCNKECQNNHWPIHKPMCKPHDPQQTWAIQLLDKEEFTKLGTEEESARFRHIRIPNTHPIFRTGEICPIVARCGIQSGFARTPQSRTGRSIGKPTSSLFADRAA
ncbi:hypothetical protein JOM56_008946 [Amanita muscaria]